MAPTDKRLFLDLFAGASSPVSLAIAELGLARLEPVDVLVGPAHNLLDDLTFQNLQRLCSSGLIGVAAAALPALHSLAQDSVTEGRRLCALSRTLPAFPNPRRPSKGAGSFCPATFPHPSSAALGGLSWRNDLAGKPFFQFALARP